MRSYIPTPWAYTAVFWHSLPRVTLARLYSDTLGMHGCILTFSTSGDVSTAIFRHLGRTQLYSDILYLRWRMHSYIPTPWACTTLFWYSLPRVTHTQLYYDIIYLGWRIHTCSLTISISGDVYTAVFWHLGWRIHSCSLTISISSDAYTAVF